MANTDKPSRPSVRITRHNGAMTLEINGRRRPFSTYKITETPDTKAMLAAAELEVPAMAKAGVDLLWIPIFVDWRGPGQYDFTDMDRRIQTVLELWDTHAPAGAEPACIAVRIQAAVFSPAWYINQALDENGKATRVIEFRNPWATVESCTPAETDRLRYQTSYSQTGSTFSISPGDPFWDTHAIDALEAIIRHVQAAPYAHRVFAWLPCALNTNEWFLRTFAAEATCDFSAPAQKAFREYLLRKGLSAVPEQPVPSAAACQAPGRGEFLDPAQPEARRIEEFSLWLNQRIGEIILRFARTLRQHHPENSPLAGFFYGYTTELSRFEHLAHSGHLDLARVLASPDVDFLCSPCQYFYRRDEGAFTYNLVLGPFANSAALCGKLAYAEDDHPPAFAHGTNADLTTRDDWHDEMYFRRNFAQVATHGQQMWWYSLGAGWLKEPRRQKLVAQLHSLGRTLLEQDRTPVAQVAVVIDERSVAAMRLNPAFQQAVILDSVAAFFPTGTPIECYELQSFLKHADFARFRFIAFPNLFLADDATRAAIRKVQGGGRTLLFSYAPGFLQGDSGTRTFSATAAGEFTGIKLAPVTEPFPLTIWVDPDRTSLLRDGADVRYGWLYSEIAAAPLLEVADPAAEPLGFLRSGAVGFARKRHADWTAVFSSAPGIPQKVLQALFRDAGVHLYTATPDVVYANRSLIAVVASERGQKTLTLPGPVRLVDALDGTAVPLDSANSANLFLRRHETRLLQVENC